VGHKSPAPANCLIWAPTGDGAGVNETEVPMERIKAMVYGQAGQATTEYSVVLLIACLVAAALGAFIKGGGIDSLFEGIVAALKERFAS
jgi:hypothetical protein